MTEKYNYCDFEMMAACRAVEALAQSEQEPVAHVYLFEPNGRPRVAWDNANGIKIGDKLYTAPPQRKPLTDEEMKKIWYAMQNIMGLYSFQEIARAIEAAHGIGEKPDAA